MAVELLQFEGPFELEEDGAEGVVDGELDGEVVAIFGGSADSRVVFSL